MNCVYAIVYYVLFTNFASHQQTIATGCMLHVCTSCFRLCYIFFVLQKALIPGNGETKLTNKSTVHQYKQQEIRFQGIADKCETLQ